MISIGRTQELTVSDISPHGPFLTDGETRILLPARLAPRDIQPGERITVFVTTDSEDRPVATTQRPAGEVGQCVALKVKEVTTIGAFLDWGLDKDLLLPFGEQASPVREGQMIVAKIVLDEKTGRVVATTRLKRHLHGSSSGLEQGTQVDGLVTSVGRDGARVIINQSFLGAIFADEMREPLRVGDARPFWIKRIREDGEVALALGPSGYVAAQGLGPQIMERLRREGGFLPLSDHSSPDEIQRAFGVSKGTFKKAIGTLQKQGHITIEFHGIRQTTK